MQEDGRPDPDALLAALPDARPTQAGHLKIFLGAAPGVGKTWEMLVQARRRAADGLDVVAGIIETHGRADTEAQLADLPVLPRRPIAYRGQTIPEFDLDAALARRPGLLLVDELAHTNAPGSRHAKRWEDVADLLAAGIPVWATLNVQHLESLNDDIARITGIRPTETLPDRVLDMADEIELIDLPPAELRARLQGGKIYPPETAARALDGFFREGNLTALREVALRRAANRVDADVRALLRRAGHAGAFPTGERIVALVGPDQAAESVVRQAKRLADALHGPWVVLHIEKPGQPAATALRAPLTIAAQLGAELDLRAAATPDLAGALLGAARARNATHLVIGRSPTPAWRRRLGLSLTAQLLRRGTDFVVHVVPAPTAVPAPRRPQRPAQSRLALPWLAVGLALALVTGAGIWFRHTLPAAAADMVYLAVTVSVAALLGTRYALVSAALGLMLWDFFFVAPLYTITIDSPRDLVTGLVFAAIALLTGSLAGRVRAEVEAASARIEGLRRIAVFSRRLGQPATEPELLTEIAQQAAGLAQRAIVLQERAGDLTPVAAAPSPVTLDEGSAAAAQWCATHNQPTGLGTTTLPSAPWHFLPLSTVRGLSGVLGVNPDAPLTDPLGQALEALADQAAVALERLAFAGQAARAAAMEETQSLRTALLASLGHDLRTPLTGIQGAASTLRTAWEKLSPPSRADLLETIEQDVARMARFLGNITDLTRLETGQILPRLGRVPVVTIIEAAIARLPDSLSVTVNAPPGLAVQADPALLEQALFNVLENARKYAPLGSLIAVRAEAARGQVTIAIADEGIGIPPEDLPHIFDSFFRARRTDRTAAGLGLGLAIARGLMRAMGGTIAAQSPNPAMPAGGMQGTVIRLTLPEATQA